MSAVTIAATLVSLAAGFVSARQLAETSVPEYYTGGPAPWSPKGGFTGSGDPRQSSTAIGPKPYRYHRMEYVMPHEVVGTGDNLREFERIHRNGIDIAAERRSLIQRLSRGRMNMDQMMPPGVKLVVAGGGMSDEQVDRIVRAIADKPVPDFHLDDEGLHRSIVTRQSREAAKNTRR